MNQRNVDLFIIKSRGKFYIVNLNDIRDGISKFLGIYLIIQRYIQEIYTIEIISNVTFHMRGPFIVR